MNARDHFGRTALHLICSSTEPSAIDYLHALLSHPSINVNLGDLESGWTALHRALYNGNLLICLTLLRRNDVDIRAKDFEGLTPFDLFNGTIHGSNPLTKGEGPGSTGRRDTGIVNGIRAASRLGDILETRSSAERRNSTEDEEEDEEEEADSPTPNEDLGAFNPSSDLFVWGANRNFTLGLGDAESRALPDRVTLRKEFPSNLSLPVGNRYDRVRIREVKMSKMHTVVLTSERSSNVWVCGIGSGGRLGRANGTQTSFEPLKDFKERAISVAVGPDHTLLSTSNGGVYSFGSSRFNTLGYNVEQGLGVVGSSASNNSSKGGGALSATFGQVNHSKSSAQDLDIQISPRKLAGPLKKERVLGVAASKLHSACFTAEGSLFTWGTNTGQLGYDRSATPVQLQPRKVTAAALSPGSSSSNSSPIIQQITATEFATAILLSSWDVIVLHNDGAHRVHFPMNRFGPEISVFRPRQAQPKSIICRLTSSGTTFAALSDMGDLFTFSLNHPSDYANSSAAASQSSLLNSTTANSSSNASGGAFAALSPSVHQQEVKYSSRPAIIKPQLVWSVRKRFTAVRDVAIGSDGSIILCTESGHVFVRTRKTEGSSGGGEGANSGQNGIETGKGKGGSFKFQAVPLLQRITHVSMSESGGMAAIRSGVSLKEIPIQGKSLNQDLEKLLPHLKMTGQRDEIVNEMDELVERHGKEIDSETKDKNDGEEDGDSDTERESFRDSQVRMARLLGEAASRWSKNEDQENQDRELPYGYDIFVVAGSRSIPAHRSILAARIPSLSSVLENPSPKGCRGNAPEGVVARKVPCSLDGNRTCVSLSLPGCSFATALFLLHYLYTDEIPAVWTSSIGLAIEKEYITQKVNKSQIHSQLRNLAKLLNLTALLPCLDSPVPRQPSPRLASDMSSFFDSHVDVESPESSGLRDVELRLGDRVVPCHTAVLRRSPFFSALLQLDWTSNRWRSDGVLEIEMSHLKWRIGKILLKHLYTDSTFSTFNGVDSDLDKQDEFLDFVVESLAFSNELLLEKLKSVCQVLLQRRLQLNNISAILTDSDTYHCLKLKEVCMEICTRSLETLLENNMLDELGHKALKDLTLHVRKRQDDRMHRTQAKQRLEFLCDIHKEWMEDLDIPKPSLNLVCNKVQKRSSLPSTRRIESRSESSNPASGNNTPSRRKVTWGSPELRPLTQNLGGSGTPTQSIPSLGDAGLMFSMDDEEGDSSIDTKPQSAAKTVPWKSKSAAERASEASSRVESPSPSPSPSIPPPVNSAPSVDLRSIMAAQQRPSPLASHSNSGNVTPIKGNSTPVDASSKVSVPLNMSSKMSQKDRKKQAQAQQQQASATILPTSPSNRTSAAPWAPGSSTPQPSSPWARSVSQPGTPSSFSLDGSYSNSGTSPSTLPSSPTQARPVNNAQSQSFLRKSLSNAASNADQSSDPTGLGPTYTPIKLQGRSSGGNRTPSR